MNYFLLQDLESGKVDAIIITSASREEVQNLVYKVKDIEDYTWEDLKEMLPKDMYLIECFNDEKCRIYY